MFEIGRGGGGGVIKHSWHHQVNPLHSSAKKVVPEAFAANNFSDRKIAATVVLICMRKQLIKRDPMPPSLSGTRRT